MVDLSCSTGGMVVIASGLGITFSKDADYDIHLKFSEEKYGTFEFTVRLVFEDNSEVKGSLLKPDVDTDGGLIILRCINFNDLIGTGRLEPIELATYGGRKIYFNFWIMASQTVHEIRYCFYMETRRNEE